MVRIINIDTKTHTIRVSNGKDDLEWFTTDTGSHVPLKKGQSKAEAIKEHFGDKTSSDTLATKKAKLHLDFKAGRITQKQLEDGLNKLAIGPNMKDKEAVAKDRKEREKALKDQEQEEADYQARKKSKQPAKQGKGTDEDGRVWIKMGGAIIPLRDGVSADDIDPKMLATPEEIKQGRAKYDGIKDRQDAAREKAKSGRTYADVIDEENWEELSRKYLRDFGGGKKLNHVELNSLMNGDKLNIIEKRKVREAMRKIGGLEE